MASARARPRVNLLTGAVACSLLAHVAALWLASAAPEGRWAPRPGAVWRAVPAAVVEVLPREHEATRGPASSQVAPRPAPPLETSLTTAVSQPTARAISPPRPTPRRTGVRRPAAVIPAPAPAAEVRRPLTPPVAAPGEVAPEAGGGGDDAGSGEAASEASSPTVGGEGELPAGGDGGGGPALDERVQAYLAELSRRAHAAARYPRAARRLGLEGVTLVACAIASDGRVIAPRVARSSGVPALDRAALDACLDLALPPPDAALLPALGDVRIPVRFAIPPPDSP